MGRRLAVEEVRLPSASAVYSVTVCALRHGLEGAIRRPGEVSPNVRPYKAVGNVRNNGPELVVPTEAPGA